MNEKMSYEEFKRMALGLYLQEIKFYFKEDWDVAMLNPNSNLRKIMDKIMERDAEPT